MATDNKNQKVSLSQWIDRADRSSVSAEFRSVASNWSHGRWLKQGNQYESNPEDRIKSDHKNKISAKSSDLCEYIAASALGHCADGWSFLGRAIEADLRGDPDAAGHMAYYAELRAAMSLLAAEGIGVFKSTHVAVVGPSQCQCFNSAPTHDFVWDAFDQWAQSKKSKDLLFRAVRPYGSELGEWTRAFGMSAAFVVSDWLGSWGIDLQRFRSDRESRNVSSYRPNSFRTHRPSPVSENIRNVSSYWQSCEPSGQSSFSLLDRQLLASALSEGHHPMYSGKPDDALADFRSRLRRTCDSLPMPEHMRTMAINYLAENYRGSFPLLQQANGADTPFTRGYSRQIIARALLMLRIATGSVRELLSDSSSSDRELLSFWWRQLGEEHGLWHPGDEPEEFIDLWGDIDDSMASLASWLESDPASQSYRELWSSHAPEASSMGTTERIPLWSLGL